MKTFKRALSFLLVFCMILGILPMGIFATTTETTEDSVEENTFVRIFHLDAGRKYFSVDEIKGIIDQLAENNYTHLELVFGNDGFRFLLDDMSVDVDGDGAADYSDDAVTSAVTSGNTSYSSTQETDASILSEADMDAILSYAAEKGIGIIPLLNVPGHTNALNSAMSELGVTTTTGANMNLGSSEIAFAKALLQKYVDYFAANGSTFFNIGADEYSNSGSYETYVSFVNDIAAMIKTAGMRPIAFNDCIQTGSGIDTDIVIAYWTASNVSAASELSAAGFDILNYNDSWYYVLGDALYDKWASGQWGYEDSKAGLQTVKCTEVKGSSDVVPIGSCLPVWCDYPSYTYDAEKVYDLIATMASSNSDYFTETTESGSSTKTTVWNTDETISVTAPDLTSVQVTKVTSPVYSAEDATVIGYEITPCTSDGAYTGAGVVTIRVPDELSGFNSIKVYDAETEEFVVSAVKNGVVTFTASHFSEYDIVAQNVLEEKTVNVTVGGTATVTIQDGDYSNNVDKTDLDENIATVTAEYKQVEGGKVLQEATTIESGSQYLIVNTRASKLLTNTATTNQSTNGLSLDGTPSSDSANLWTITSYGNGYTVTYSSTSRYLTIGNNTASTATSSATLALNYSSSNGTWTIAQTVRSYGSNTTYYLNDFGGNGTVAAGWSGSGASTDAGSQWKLYKVVDTEPYDATVLTITGVTAGNTYVTVNGVKYTINVVTEDLTNAATLPIQLWITSSMIPVTDVTTATTGSFWPYGSGYPAYYVSVSAEDAYGINGVELSTLVPTGVSTNNTATTSADTTAKYVLWKGTVLDSDDTGLQGLWGDNMVHAGTDYTYVRYYNGAWAVSADRVNWTTVTGKGSTSNYDSCTEQVIAYYMQRTEVTDQVITDVVDYGDILSEKDSTQNDIKAGRYVILDYAVNVNGTLTPDTFPVNGKTQLFHCAGTGNDTGTTSYRRLNEIYATETSVYEVYMITITPTENGAGTTFTTGEVPTDYAYDGTEYVIWAESADAVPDGYATADQYTVGSYTYSVTYGGEPIIDELYIYNRQGMLVTYYVRGVQTEDSLTIEYVDDTTGDTFYTSSLPVKVEGERTKDFTNSLLDADGKVYTVTGDTTLDDNTYYVVEYYGAKVYVRTELTQIPDLHGVYTTGVYTQVKAEIDPTDSKVLIIHYTYDDSKRQANFVVDFGLPVTVNYSQLGLTNTDDITNYEVSGGTYGMAVESSDGTSFTYTPNVILKGTDEVTVTVTYQDGSTSAFRVGFIPATTVYYEEGFATYTGFWSGTTSVNYTATQATQIAGESSDEYGYDAAYAGNVDASNGTQVTSNNKGDKAEFTFTGTGVDIYTNSTTETGWLVIQVKNESTTVKLIQVDTSLKNGTTDATAGQDVIGYNVPVASITGLTHGEYTVTITHIDENTVNLDGFRVYGTRINQTVYEADKEDNPTFIELRDEVLTAQSVNTDSSQYASQIAGQVYSESNLTSNGAIILNADENITKDELLADLLDNGPKNEIYLQPNQALVFTITTSREVQIGLKALNDSTSYTINGTEQTLSSSTDMFYTVLNKANSETTSTITITNKGEGILAITKLKVCDDPDAALGTLTEEDLIDALVSLGFEEDPTETTEPDVETPTLPGLPAFPVQSGKLQSIYDMFVQQILQRLQNLLGRR